MDPVNRKNGGPRNARVALLRNLSGDRFIDPAVRLSSALIAVTLVSYGDAGPDPFALAIQALAAGAVVLCSFKPLPGMALAASALVLELATGLDIGVHIAVSACIAISLTYLRWKVATIGSAFICLSVIWKLFMTPISLTALVQVEGYVLVLALILGASGGLGQQRLDAALFKAEVAGRDAEQKRSQERTGIARDVHDLISFNLTRETLILNSIRLDTTVMTDDHLAELRMANHATQRSLRQLTKTLTGPAALGKIAQTDDLQTICEDVEHTFNGLATPLTVSCHIPARFCSVHAFRHLECIITEAASNILRHHDKNRRDPAAIDIYFDEQTAELAIRTSNPCNPASEKREPHSLVSRVDELGGAHSIHVNSTFSLEAHIPGELQSLAHYCGEHLSDIRDLTDASSSDLVFRFRHEDCAFADPRRIRFDRSDGDTESH